MTVKYVISALRDDNVRLWLTRGEIYGTDWWTPEPTAAKFFPLESDARTYLKEALSGVNACYLLGMAANCSKKKPIRTVEFTVEEVSWIQINDKEIIEVDITTPNWGL